MTRRRTIAETLSDIRFREAQRAQVLFASELGLKNGSAGLASYEDLQLLWRECHGTLPGAAFYRELFRPHFAYLLACARREERMGLEP